MNNERDDDQSKQAPEQQQAAQPKPVNPAATPAQQPAAPAEQNPQQK